VDSRTKHEPHRDPAWFSAAEAKEKLAEGRNGVYAREFERIIGLALARIGA
jgi:hypothetical protein